jgi:hypothetical protein
MSLPINIEDSFINNLESYFDTKFDKYTRNRITTYLVEYKSLIPQQKPIILNKEKIVYKYIQTKDISIKEGAVRIDTDKIIDTVCNVTHIKKERLYSTKRDSEIVTARHIAMFLLKDLAGLSLFSIGKIFNKHHSTVIYAISHVTKMVEIKDENYTFYIHEANKILHSNQLKKSA